MLNFSIRKFVSSKTSQEPSAAPPQTAAREAKSSKSRSFMGALGDLRPRREKVHPEPMQPPPRAALPSMSRPESAAVAHQPSVFNSPPRRQAPSMPTRKAPAPAPAVRQQRTEPAEVRRNPRPAASETDRLLGMLQELEVMMAASNKKNHELQMKAFDAETPEEEMAVEQELTAFKKERAELIELRKTGQARLDFIAKPQANELVQTLMQLSQVSGPRQSGGQRDVIRGNVDALRRHGGLLGKREELIATQQQLRKTLESGSFNGLPPAEFKQMRELAHLNIDTKLGQLTDLKAVVRQTERQLAAMGAGGLFNGVATTPRERERMRQEELRLAQDALDNGYR